MLMHHLFDESGRHFLPLFSQIFRPPPALAGGFAYNLSSAGFLVRFRQRRMIVSGNHAPSLKRRC